MNQNILKTTDITSIYIMYMDKGVRRKHKVKLKFMDRRECYFVNNSPNGFVKPKNNIPVQITVYTPDGVYSTEVKLSDTNISLTEVLFCVTIPKEWKFKQLRLSSRKIQGLPFTVKYNDGFEISTQTYDLAINGISFIYRDTFPSIYERIPCILTLTLPKSLIINFPDGKLVTEGHFVRKKIHTTDYGIEDGMLLAYRFVNLKHEEQEILKNYLLSLD